MILKMNVRNYDPDLEIVVANSKLIVHEAREKVLLEEKDDFQTEGKVERFPWKGSIMSDMSNRRKRGRSVWPRHGV